MTTSLELVDEKRAAKILGVSERTLQGWRCRGGNVPPFVRLGSNGRVRYMVSALRVWCEENTRRSTSDLGQDVD